MGDILGDILDIKMCDIVTVILKCVIYYKCVINYVIYYVILKCVIYYVIYYLILKCVILFCDIKMCDILLDTLL